MGRVLKDLAGRIESSRGKPTVEIEDIDDSDDSGKDERNSFMEEIKGPSTRVDSLKTTKYSRASTIR